MGYKVKEIFYSLQGEGANAGRAAIFCRLSGCNLKCHFCDTDWQGTDGKDGGEYNSPESLISAISKHCLNIPSSCMKHMVVFTGGEPSLQLDRELIETLHKRNFEVAVETNGTMPIPPGIDWITVSPKSGSNLIIQKGNELKLLYPLDEISPEDFLKLDFQHFFLQPVDGPEIEINTRSVIKYCLENPRWRLSIQLHKLLGIK